MHTELVNLMIELNTNDELRVTFKADREGTMKAHGVPEADRQLVLNQKYDEIQSILGADYEISKNHIIEAFKVKKLAS